MSGNQFQLYALDLAWDFLEHYAKDVSEHEAGLIPLGFNNSILWNVGHIVTFTEEFLFVDTNRGSKVPDYYKELFWRGTKPAEWKVQPPTLQTLLEQLQDQITRIKETFHDHLDEKLAVARPFPMEMKPATVAELLPSLLFHWGLHVSAVNSLKRAIRAANQS